MTTWALASLIKTAVFLRKHNKNTKIKVQLDLSFFLIVLPFDTYHLSFKTIISYVSAEVDDITTPATDFGTLN